MIDVEFQFVVYGHAIVGYDPLANLCEDRSGECDRFRWWDRTHREWESGLLGYVSSGVDWKLPPLKWCLAGLPASEYAW